MRIWPLGKINWACFQGLSNLHNQSRLHITWSIYGQGGYAKKHNSMTEEAWQAWPQQLSPERSIDSVAIHIQEANPIQQYIATSRRVGLENAG